jgi:hypothetical protein
MTTVTRSSVIMLSLALGLIAQSGRPKVTDTPDNGSARKGTVRVYVDSFSGPTSLEELSGRAEVIVLGRITDVDPGHIQDPKNPASIETDARVTVEKVVKGTLTSSTIIVSEIGGSHDGLVVAPAENRLFRVGQRYVLFLRSDKRPNAPDLGGLARFTITGVFAGKVRVDASGNVAPHSAASSDIQKHTGESLDIFLATVSTTIGPQRQ